VLPRASTVEWSARCRSVSLGPVERLPDVTGNARFIFWIVASQGVIWAWIVAASETIPAQIDQCLRGYVDDVSVEVHVSQLPAR
jgi:hypothetical protein